MSKYLAVENLAVKNNPKAVIVIEAGFILDQWKSCSVGSKLGSQRKYFLLKKEDMEWFDITTLRCFYTKLYRPNCVNLRGKFSFQVKFNLRQKYDDMYRPS